jgi:hypothetical protein
VLLDVESAPVERLAPLLEGAADSGGVSVLVDLGAREDATADLFALLHRTARDLRRRGGRLAVVSARAHVRGLLAVTLIGNGFEVHATRDDALWSWR